MGFHKGGLLFLGLLLCAGCGGRLDPFEQPFPSPSPLGAPVDLDQLEAPGVPTNWTELKRLQGRAAGPDRDLRRASLYLQVERPTQAQAVLDALAGDPGLDRERLAVVHYLQARVCQVLGLPDSARSHRDRARRVTRDSHLVSRLDGLVLTPPPAPAVREATAAPQVLVRSTWSARRPIKSRLNPMGRVWRLTVHHTAMDSPGPDRAAVIAHLRTLQRSHIGQRGWADLGYHYLIDPAGRIWEGRQVKYQGAHAGSPTLNRGNIGVCLLGNFMHHRPNRAELAALRRLVADLVARYGIRADRILGHRDLKSSTACPGTHLYREVQALRGARP